MNRNERRKTHKLTSKELKELESKAILKGVKGTMRIYESVIRRELGFGDKRYYKLEKAIKEKLGMEVEDE